VAKLYSERGLNPTTQHAIPNAARDPQLARRILRWFGSAARPAVRATARSTVRLGGMPGYLPDSSLGNSVRRCVGSAACQFGGVMPDSLPDDSIRRHVGSAATCAATRFSGVPGVLPDSSRDDSIRRCVRLRASCLTARLSIRFGGESVRWRPA
jgi:hypothetical protein